MIKLIDKQKIIIMHTNEGKSQRQISRKLNIDRKTIRKYLREYDKKKKELFDAKPEENTIPISDIVSKPTYNSSFLINKLRDEFFNYKLYIVRYHVIEFLLN